MIIQIGAETNKAKALAKAFGEEIVSVNAESRASLLKQLSPKDILIAELSNDLQYSDKELLRSAVAEGATLVLENITSSESMAEYAVIGIEATTAVIKSAYGGQNQQIIVDSPGKQGVLDTRLQEVTVEQGKSGEAVPEAIRNATLARGIFPGKQALKESPEIERAEGASPAVELSEEEKIQRLALWLKDDSFQKSLEQSDKSVAWSQHNPSQAHATVIVSSVRWQPSHNPQREQLAEYYGSLDVDVYATMSPRKKFVKIKSTGSAVSIPNGLWRDNDWEKAYFTVEGRFMLYPGTEYILPDEKQRIHLPSGWRRIHMEPQTENSVTKYTSTTGWSVGVTAEGGGSAQGPQGSVSLTASYNQSNTIEREIPDFRVRNSSSSAVCDWTYEFSQLKNNWRDLFTEWFWHWPTVNNLPLLARSAMSMENEAVYEAPDNTRNNQTFVFYMLHGTGSLWVEQPNIFKYQMNHETSGHHNWWAFSVNMSRVTHPN